MAPTSQINRDVLIREVSPRDGLQSWPKVLDPNDIVTLVEAILECQFSAVEVGSFVSPKWVPQMQHTAEVFHQLEEHHLKTSTQLAALIPNMQGLEAALKAPVQQGVFFVSLSETYSQKNLNCSVAESLERLKPVAKKAMENGLDLTVDISMAFGCPWEGWIPTWKLASLVEELVHMGFEEIYLADTTGTGNPKYIKDTFKVLLHEYPQVDWGLHMHDTRGTAIANVYSSLELGVNRFDTSLGGIGGGPYAKGATGNVATQDLVFLLESLGVKTGVNMEKLLVAGEVIEKILGESLNSRVQSAGIPEFWHGPVKFEE